MFSVLGVLAAEALLAILVVLAGAQTRFRAPRGRLPGNAPHDGLAAADALRTRGILRVVVPAGFAVFLLLPLLDPADWRRGWMVSAMLGATTMAWGAALIEMVRPSRLHGGGPVPPSAPPRGLRRLVVASATVLGVLLLLGWASGSSGSEVGRNEPDGLVSFRASSLVFLEPWPGASFVKPGLAALACLLLVVAVAAQARRRNRGAGGEAGASTSTAAATLALAFCGLGLVVPLVQTGLMILGHGALLPGFLLELQILAGIGILLAAWTAAAAFLAVRRALSRTGAVHDAVPEDRSAPGSSAFPGDGSSRTR